MNGLTNKRIAYSFASAIGLLLVYLFQREIEGYFVIADWSVFTSFAVGRIVRFLLNDIFTLLLIWSLFPERKYFLFAMMVQVTGMIVFLFPYLIIKYHYPRYNGPLISFLHRLILNPILLMLLIPAFMFQQQRDHPDVH